MLKIAGCSERCATEKHYLTPGDILRYHEHYSSRSQQAKKQWLLDYLTMNSLEGSTSTEVALSICGKSVCLQLWLSTLGVSQSHYYSVRGLYLKGHKRIVSEIQRTPLPRTNEAVAWIEGYVSLMGDKMPNRATIHLPSSVSKVSMYQRMMAELKVRGKIDIISQSQFFGVWKTFFCHVTIPKVCTVFELALTSVI